MRRAIINLALISAFIGVTVALARIFVGYMEFNAARDLEMKYRWNAAAEKYKKAIKINPYDTSYLAEYGDFLLMQGAIRQKRGELLKEAEALFERAIQLNPRSARYYLKLGQAQLDQGLWLMESEGIADRKKLRIDEAFGNFEKAVLNDPAGFNTSYSIGYEGLLAWSLLTGEEKEFVLDRLKYSLLIKAKYMRYVYPKLWEVSGDFALLQRVTPPSAEANEKLYNFMTRNNLWQFRKGQEEILNFYKSKEAPERLAKEKRVKLEKIRKIKADTGARPSEKILPEDWKGLSADGKYPIVNGRMYWNGTVYAVLDTEPGDLVIHLDAKKYQVIETPGPLGPGCYPYMIVRLDEELIGETFVGTDEWKEYSFTAKTDGGAKVLSVTFVNDIYKPAKKEDRNLFVGEAQISRR